MIAAAALTMTLGAAPMPAAAAVFTFTTVFDDPAGASAPYRSALVSHLDAALAEWGRHLSGMADYEISVEVTPSVARATGRSAALGLVGVDAVGAIYEAGAAYELRTGLDPNGALVDIELQFNPDYLTEELWFDPDPISRTAAVPGNRIDALSVVMHEIGHALGFNGWGDPYTGAWPVGYASTWDRQVAGALGGGLAFTGAQAVSLYGAPVPVTWGNNFHIGNAAGPGADLLGDLMNGVVYNRGQRYAVSALDVAILADIGLPVVQTPPAPLPTPGTGWLALLATPLAVGVTAAARRRARRDVAAAA